MKISTAAKLVVASPLLIFSNAQADVTPNVLDSSGKAVRDGQKECLQNLVSVSLPECEAPKVPAAPKAEPVKVAEPAPPPAPPIAPPPPPAAPAPAPAPKIVTLEADALFDFDKSVLKPQGKAKIDELAAQIQAQGSNLESIAATGHTDSIGTDRYNQKLSERRAAAVKQYLISKGIPVAKISSVGKGESVPVADNKTKSGRAQNRRVEIEVKLLKQP